MKLKKYDEFKYWDEKMLSSFIRGSLLKPSFEEAFLIFKKSRKRNWTPLDGAISSLGKKLLCAFEELSLRYVDTPRLFDEFLKDLRLKFANYMFAHDTPILHTMKTQQPNPQHAGNPYGLCESQSLGWIVAQARIVSAPSKRLGFYAETTAAKMPPLAVDADEVTQEWYSEKIRDLDLRLSASEIIPVSLGNEFMIENFCKKFKLKPVAIHFTYLRFLASSIVEFISKMPTKSLRLVGFFLSSFELGHAMAISIKLIDMEIVLIRFYDPNDPKGDAKIWLPPPTEGNKETLIMRINNFLRIVSSPTILSNKPEGTAPGTEDSDPEKTDFFLFGVDLESSHRSQGANSSTLSQIDCSKIDYSPIPFPSDQVISLNDNIELYKKAICHLMFTTDGTISRQYILKILNKRLFDINSTVEVLDFTQKFNLYCLKKIKQTLIYASSALDCTWAMNLLLAEGANPRIGIPDENNYNALHIAAILNSLGAASILLNFDQKMVDNNMNAGGFTALFLATRAHNTHMVGVLLGFWANPNIATNVNRLTAVHLAALKGFTDILVLFSNEATADLNATTSKGLTPLHFAVNNGFVDAVNLLLQCPRVDISLRTNDNKSALDLAIEQIEKKAEDEFHREKYRSIIIPLLKVLGERGFIFDQALVFKLMKYNLGHLVPFQIQTRLPFNT